MKERRLAYCIQIHAHWTSVGGQFHYLCEKNELALSKNRRPCGLFHKNMARFSTEAQAKAFLETVNKKPDWEYSILEIWESD